MWLLKKRSQRKLQLPKKPRTKTQAFFSNTISFVKRWRMELATAADRQEVAKDPKEEKKEAKDSKVPILKT